MMMILLVKLITGYMISLLLLIDSPDHKKRDKERVQEVTYQYQESPEVLFILEHKCNVCHKRRNRRRVFTRENMEGYKSDIYKQVFIRKRMPKGNSVRLTVREQQELLTWISSTKIERHGI